MFAALPEFCLRAGAKLFDIPVDTAAKRIQFDAENLVGLAMDVEAILRELTNAPDYEGQIVHVERVAAREAQYAKRRKTRLPVRGLDTPSSLRPI